MDQHLRSCSNPIVFSTNAHMLEWLQLINGLSHVLATLLGSASGISPCLQKKQDATNVMQTVHRDPDMETIRQIAREMNDQADQTFGSVDITYWRVVSRLLTDLDDAARYRVMNTAVHMDAKGAPALPGVSPSSVAPEIFDMHLDTLWGCIPLECRNTPPALPAETTSMSY